MTTEMIPGAGGIIYPLERPPSPPAKPPLDFQSIRPPNWERWGSTSRGGLTPSRVVSAYSSAEMGFPYDQCNMFDAVIERDGHLRSQVGGRLSAVAGKSWILQAGGNATGDATAAQLLEQALRRVPRWKSAVKHLQREKLYGWSGLEVRWDRVDGVIVPVWFARTPHRRFIFDQWDTPRLVTDETTWRGEDLTPGGWLWAASDAIRVVQGGLMRTATWWSMMKSWAVRDWIMFSERFGLPYPMGKYGDNMPEEEKKVLRDAVASLGKDGYACFSDTGHIEFAKIESGGQSDDVQGAIIGLCNAEISKLITGATLTSGEGTSAGSYALGRVHQDRSYDLAVDDADDLADVFGQLASQFISYNGFDAEPPRLKINIVREVDPEVSFTIKSRAANELGMGLDEDQMRQEYDLKRPNGKPVVGQKLGQVVGQPPAGADGGTV